MREYSYTYFRHHDPEWLVALIYSWPAIECVVGVFYEWVFEYLYFLTSGVLCSQISLKYTFDIRKTTLESNKKKRNRKYYGRHKSVCDLQRHTGERTYTYTSINCSIYVGVLRRKNLYIFLYKIYVYVLIVLCSCLVVCFQQQQKTERVRERGGWRFSCG